MKWMVLPLIAMEIVTFPSVESRAANPLNSPEAMSALRARAATGELAAMHELGTALQGDQDPNNDIEGRDLLIRAANDGYWNSAAFLARSYLYGWYGWAQSDHEPNSAEGLRWLKRAAEMAPPDVPAADVYSMLGNIYSHHLMRRMGNCGTG